MEVDGLRTGEHTMPTKRRRVLIPLALLLILLSGCGDFKRFLYEGIGRDRWQFPEEVVQSLGIRPGDHVADLGAGGGYFTFRLADAVGPSGLVYAVDVDESMTAYLKARAAEEGRANIKPILAPDDDPSLPEHGVDLIFTCNTYHHVQARVAYFGRARRYLRDGGRVAIIDYTRSGWFQKLFGHYTAREVIVTEMEAAGYRVARDHDFLPKQSFLVFALSD
jgi:arsenite methyltransferase